MWLRMLGGVGPGGELPPGTQERQPSPGRRRALSIGKPRGRRLRVDGIVLPFSLDYVAGANRH